MLRKTLATIAAAALLILGGATAASADGWGEGGADCSGPDCWVWGGEGGESGGGGGSSGGGGDAISIGFTPGTPRCWSAARQDEVPCSVSYLDDNYWSNGRQCYVTLATAMNQDPTNRPGGGSADGAWYVCYVLTGATGTDTMASGIFWSNTPPAGITSYSPAQAARIIISRFQLRGIEIGRTPVGGDKTYIGLPVWLWANNPQPLNYGPYTETVTIGGQTITATAQVSSVHWNMGDGTRFSCGAGTPYQDAYGISPSPTCDHTYTRTGDYTITAESHWIVMWSGGGASGQISVITSSTAPLEIGELQSVNVPNP